MGVESQDISFEMRRLGKVLFYFGPKIALKGSNGTDQRAGAKLWSADLAFLFAYTGKHAIYRGGYGGCARKCGCF